MRYVIAVDNNKCGGCAATIEKAVAALQGVRGIGVDVEQQTVAIDGEAAGAAASAEALDRLGYPRRGSANGLLKQARSVISCAIGRVSR